MKNAKLNIVFAAFGFLLSFIVGIFSPVTFGMALLRAVIFSALFVGLSIGIQVLFKTVLSTGGDEQSDAVSSGEDAKKVGSIVDITLPDEDLPTVENAPRFLVGTNHQMLNESDYRRQMPNNAAQMHQPSVEQPVLEPQATATVQPEAAQSVQQPSQSQAEAAQAAAGAGASFTAAPLASVAKSSASAKTAQPAVTESLPNMIDLNLGDDDGDEAEDAELPQENTGDEGVAVAPPRPATKSNTNMDNKDTVLMARAISTVLASDPS